MEETPARSTASHGVLQPAPASTPALDYGHDPLICSESVKQVPAAVLGTDPAAACSTQRRLVLCNDTIVMDIEPELLQVPGATTKAYISRQVLLAQIVSSLALTVHSSGVLNESDSDIRAWIEIDIPPGGDQPVVERKTFYSDLARSAYGAMEGATQAVVTHLIKERQIQVHDANYDELTSLKKTLQAARSFEDIYRGDEQIKLAYVASLKELSQALLCRLQQICINHAGFLPLEISTSPKLAIPGRNCTVRYTGHMPPTTPHESLAMRLADLASVHIVAGLTVPTSNIVGK